MNRQRDLLHVNQVDAFVSWAVTEGYVSEPTKGQYERIRLRWPGQAPLLFYERSESASGAPLQHLTCTDEGTKLVRRFIRYKRTLNDRSQPNPQAL